MSDRNVRNPADALAQRLARIEERVRALSLRTWPGTVRTARSAAAVSFDASTVSLVSVTVTPGRWVVIGQTQIGVSPVTATFYNLSVALVATDSEGVVLPRSEEEDSSGILEGDLAPTGELLTGDFDLPVRVDYQNYLNAASSVFRPITVVGHFTYNDEVTVTMTARNAAGDGFSAENSCLVLLPV